MFKFLLGLSRITKRIISVFIDSISILIAYFSSLCIRYDNFDVLTSYYYWLLAFFLIFPTIFALIYLGLYRAILRYITIKILKIVIVSAIISDISLLLLSYLLRVEIPRTSAFLYFIFLSVLLIGIRISMRTLLNIEKENNNAVIIYGAGDAGRQLLTALNQMSGYFIVAFVDDSPLMHNVSLHGITVYSPKELKELVSRHNVTKILLALPNISMPRRKAIIENLQKLNCEVLSVPSLEDIVAGKATISSLNKVSIEDLLGRESVKPIEELLSANILGKSVMVTGAGGSIGSELCRQILLQKPKLLVLFEINEFALYSIEKELRNYLTDIKIIPIIGSVQNISHLDKTIHTFRIDTIYHAAAYKHVPLVEYNVIEGIRNNIFGTLYCAEAAINNGVSTFVLISTDKAVRPTNTMGASKRMAELILQAFAKKQSVTRFCMVRFGNVLGSSGSVIPLFQQQIEQGGPVTLTHQDITRYFMTIPEAASLVIQAGAMGKGGDVFVLDMGEPVKIIDLAYRMIHLSGLKVRNETLDNDDIEIKIIGLRPGEKLYEELLIGDNVITTRHPRIMKANEVMIEWNILNDILLELDTACKNGNLYAVRKCLQDAPTDFNPIDNICDLLWLS